MVNTDLLYITGGYVVAFFLALFFLNFLTAGFIRVFLLVKAARGAKALVKVYSLTGAYFTAGKFDDSDVVYKPRGSKNKKRIALERGDVWRLFNVPMLEVDEATNAVKRPDFSMVPGFDAQKSDLMVQRALMMPKLGQENKIIIILLIVSILALVVSGYAAVKVGQIPALINGLNIVQGGVIG